MNCFLSRKLLYCLSLITLFLLGSPLNSNASHIIGADLYYTNISGFQYKVTLVIYGDCAGSAFPTLPTATPQIIVYNNLTQYTTMTLVLQAPTQGLEVTPVCPSQVNDTKCVNPAGTVPGIKKFVFTGNVTLNANSTNWRFRFNGTMGSSSAGRSGAITNIQGAGSSIMALEATLNNTVAPPNSSPTLSTIPTPFFCINKPASYNPGAVDPNGDDLVFALTNALEAPSGTVLYQGGYSGSNPLAVVPGSFSFNTTNGQLNFTPNLIQVSNVVNTISEYRNGVLVGTCMREMNFYVQTCNNNPPGGDIAISNGGSILNPTTVTVCPSQGLFSFSINAVDLDNNNINLTWAGLPPGAILNVIGNGTSSPVATFSWNVTNAAPGTYTVFITFQDDGCPLASKQTIAYTIIVLPSPGIVFNIIQPATCTKKAVFTITPSNNGPWTVNVLQGSSIDMNHTNVTGTITDSLAPGTYTINVINVNGCEKDTTITIAPPPPIQAAVTLTDPLCNNDATGVIAVNVSSGTPPYQYALDGGAYGSTATFTNVAGGSHTVHIKDQNDCVKDIAANLTNPNPILYNVTTTKPPCNYFQNGAITISAYNSNAPYQYALGAGAYGSSGSFTGLYSGNYTVHIKNALGCIKDVIVVLPDSIKIQANTVITNILCHGDATGAATITASGTYPPYVYAINAGTFGNSNTFPNLTAGTYTLHVKDVDLCYYDTTITLTEPPVLNGTLTATNVLCYGTNTGTVTVNATGGVTAYSYNANGGGYQSSNVLTGLGAGTQTINIKDANGCIKVLSANITQNPATVITLSFTKPLCVGSADGTVTINATGGTPGFTYAVGAGAYSSSGSFTGLTAGTYTFHAKDANGCIKDTIFQLMNPPAIVPAVTIAQPTCNGGSDGSITLTATGGAPGYTYALGAGAYGASGSFTGLAAGSYTLHVKDANNCIKDTIVNVQDATPIHATVGLTIPPCNHFSNGSITITAFNSIAPYQYALGAGAYGSSGTFNGLFSGTYIVHIKNALGCIKDTTVILPDSVKIQGAAVVTNILCNGDATGAVTINATGAYPGYTYAVGAGAFGSSNVFTGLTAGTYTFHVLDTRQCYFDTTITLTQPTPIVVTPTVTNVLCNGANTGVITVGASGGVPSYTYANGANPYQVSNTFNTLTAGTYTVNVKDANGCIKSASAVITQPTAVSMTVVIDTPTCNGATNGQITVTGTGGVTPYSFAINAGAYGTSNVFSGLTAGSYTVHVKDNNGCIKDSTFTLTQPTPIVPAALVKKSTCATLANGSVTLSATGGTPGYTYAVGAGAYGASPTFSPLAANTYTFHIKDSKGCIKDTIIIIADSIVVHSNSVVTDATCYALNNGSITTTGFNATSPYTYAIGAGTYSSTNTFGTLLANTYTIHVKDANGCIQDTLVTVAQPTVIVPNVTIVQPLCYGDANGTITIGATGGTPGYTYALGTGAYSNANTFTGLAVGTYTLHVKDANGCVHDTTVNMAQPASVLFTVQVTNNKCFGDNSGTVQVNATGGVGGYTYAYDANAYQASSLLTGFTAGNHTIHVKDANGCIKDSVVTLTQPTQLYVGVWLQQPTCEGYKDGVISVSGVGGTAPYLFSTDNINYSTINGHAGLPEGTYTYYVKDANGCVHDTTFKLEGYPHIVYTATVTDVDCWGEKTGKVVFNVTGGMPPFIYQIKTGIFPWRSSNVFDSLKAGQYGFQIKDSKNCVKDTTIFVNQPDKLVVKVTVTPNDCQGEDNNGGVSADVSGGSTPYAYLWNTIPASTTPDIKGYANGRYTVYVTDAHNCIDSAKALVAYDNCCTPFIPDAFTPNGDGRNDIYRVRFKGDMKLEGFSIFNRFGQRLFFTTDINQGWDGTFAGKPQDLGTYFYYIKAICGNKGDNHVEFKGDVTLIR